MLDALAFPGVGGLLGRRGVGCRGGLLGVVLDLFGRRRLAILLVATQRALEIAQARAELAEDRWELADPEHHQDDDEDNRELHPAESTDDHDCLHT